MKIVMCENIIILRFWVLIIGKENIVQIVAKNSGYLIETKQDYPKRSADSPE